MKNGEPPSLTKIQNEVIRMIKKHREEREKRQMEQLKSFFSTKTRRGRAIRTGLQGFVSLLTFIGGLLAIPEFNQAMTAVGYGGQLATFAAWTGVISYVQNALESLIKWLWETK